MTLRMSLLAFSASCILVSGVGACSFTKNFGTGNSISADEVVAFNTAPGAVTTCSISCDSGAIAYLYVRYGGRAGVLLNDDADFSLADCTVATTIVSGDEEHELGWSLFVNAPYTNLTITCSCTQLRRDGDQRSSQGCFPGSASVQILNQGAISMKDLQVGDKVLTGENKYQYVYGFGHYLRDAEHEFVQIHTKEDGEPLEMTSDHMIFVKKENGEQIAIRADALKVGDVLASEGASIVSKIATVMKPGMYMPLTLDGTIVVNGIKASAYTSISQDAPSIVQNMALFGMKSEDVILHLWLSPLRVLCMGVSSKFCGIPKDDPRSPATERGLMEWLVFGRKLASFAEQQNFVVQVFFIGLPVFVIFASLTLVEQVFGSSFAPSAIVLIVAGSIWFLRKHTGSRANEAKTAG